MTFAVELGGWRCDVDCLVEYAGRAGSFFAVLILLWWGFKLWGEYIARRGDR